jgi:hypothetical protein
MVIRLLKDSFKTLEDLLRPLGQAIAQGAFSPQSIDEHLIKVWAASADVSNRCK